jgi:ribosomal protein S18 acetylase RimI-like enzyme
LADRWSPLTTRPATAADARFLAPRLRAADAREVSAHYDDPHQALLEAISGSEMAFTARLGDEPVFVIGCGSSAEAPLTVGCPWLLGTDAADRYPGALTKITRHYVGLFKERWPVLLNYVDARNTASVRWLTRLGFEVRDPVEIGMHGEHFHPFVMGA